MPTDNEWLRLIYAQLTAGGTGGASINQAQVKAAIESAVNIDGLEVPIDAPNSLMRVRDSWRVKVLGTSSPEFKPSASTASLIWTVPLNREWKIFCGSATHVAGGVVADRRVQLSVWDDSVYYFQTYISPSQVVQTANTTVKYFFGQHTLPTTLAGHHYVYFPNLVISAGQELSLTCLNRQFPDYFMEDSGFNVLSRVV